MSNGPSSSSEGLLDGRGQHPVVALPSQLGLLGDDLDPGQVRGARGSQPRADRRPRRSPRPARRRSDVGARRRCRRECSRSSPHPARARDVSGTACETAAMQPRVLVVTEDRLGEVLGGAAIRAYEIARSLSDIAEVTLAGPGTAPPRLAGARHVAVDEDPPRALRALFRSADVVIMRPPPPLVAGWLRASNARIVYDLCDPIPLDILEAQASAPRRAAPSVAHHRPRPLPRRAPRGTPLHLQRDPPARSLRRRIARVTPDPSRGLPGGPVVSLVSRPRAVRHPGGTAAPDRGSRATRALPIHWRGRADRALERRHLELARPVHRRGGHRAGGRATPEYPR